MGQEARRRQRCRRRSRRSTSSRSRRPATGQDGTHRTSAARTCRDRGDRSPASWARAVGTATGTPRPMLRAVCRHCADRPIGRELDRRRSGGGTVPRRPCERTCATGHSRRVRESGSVLPPLFLDVGHDPCRGVGEARSRGFQGFLAVTRGHCRSQRKEPLTWHNTTSEVERRRWESNPCTGLCRPLPEPLGHVAVPVTSSRPGQDRSRYRLGSANSESRRSRLTRGAIVRIDRRG